jgi:amino acid adenylation domain-containing protein
LEYPYPLGDNNLDMTSVTPPRVRPTNPFVVFPQEDVEGSVPARFERQVKLHGGRIAVKTAAHALTYAELNRAANRIAHAILARRGAGPEPVGLMLEHGAPMVASLLGVLKAGKFYVPLDPSYPDTRLAYMLEDSESRLVLTSSRLRTLAEQLTSRGAILLDIDDLGPGIDEENPGLAIAPDAFLDILYTSGSTGRPKGVVEIHKNVLGFTRARTNSCHFSADDRMSLLQSFSFSGSVTPLYGALLNGAGLYPRDLRATGPMDLGQWLIQEEITVSLMVASTFRQMVSTLTGQERFPKLRLLRIGGEPVYPRDVALYKRHVGNGCLLLNSLGSSEMKNISEYFMDERTEIAGEHVPVGYPVDGVQVLILDESGRAVPEGGAGEIVVKSRYIAPMYWRRPEETRATFLPDPAGGDERLYRTGDLGRVLPDGALVHLGRRDAQVKVRGYRIEIADVESAVLDLPEVRAAAVVARPEESGTNQLVAYLVPSIRPTPVAEVRRRLLERLPEYMVPAVFVWLDALPLNSSGKVDRRNLPDPAAARPDVESAYAAPRNPIERAVAAVWAEVLQLERVGVDDDFLDLGGDSLRATRVLVRIRDIFGADVPLRDMFAAHTVAEQATTLARRRVSEHGSAEELT